MTLSRRRFLEGVLASGALIPAAADHISAAVNLRQNVSPQDQPATIDRQALVSRHSPLLHRLDPLSPLTIGNGEFAFTADITGLQTFPREYNTAMPLCTMSHWGWHSSPLRSGLDPGALRLTEYETHGRRVGYRTSAEGQSELYTWLRENPHRLHLGQIGFRLMVTRQREAEPADLSDLEQRLDLWSGILTSRFRIDGKLVSVQTAVDPLRDLLAVKVESTLISEGRLGVRLSFPFGSPGMAAADWEQPGKHQSTVISRTANGASLHRRLDADEYFVVVDWDGQASFTDEKAHTFLLIPGTQSSHLAFSAAFSPSLSKRPLPESRAVFTRSAAHWTRFWTTGGAVELAGSRDPRAPELERRVVLSQYLTAIQCAGSRPPQETGLTVNSWYGKFHLEMHWWHAAHFALWDRTHLLEKSLAWYDTILEAARGLARSQNYSGARWPKMVGPEGRDSPSPIGPLLIWQQPHPIIYAELCYKARRDRKTLERYRRIVFESAEFMASYAFFDQKARRYVLGPPLIPAQENHPPNETWNPAFELAYWAHGLRIAQQWRVRLGMKRNPAWDQVLAGLSPLPVRDGVYLAHENCPQTYTERNYDHPSMLGALGMLPGDGVDGETMRRTLARVMKEWQWDKTWGWDFPLTAMTAARLGEPKIAVDALMMTAEKNRYLPNGHNWQRSNLPCYLPGNGGLLYAVAMMAAGWKGAPHSRAPGFPSDGSWKVRAEGFDSSLLKEI